MQKWFSIIAVLIGLMCESVSGFGNSTENILLQADSLYQKNKFAEAQALYFKLYHDGFFTDATLLKMAFAHEGLGQTAQALFFLSAYFYQTEDTKAYDKIQILANAHSLAGYELSDFERIAIWLSNRSGLFTPIIFSACLFLVALSVYCYRKGFHNGKLASVFGSLFFTAVLFLDTNFNMVPSKAVIIKPTYLMHGPSPASNLVGLVNEGHQVSLGNGHDVWAQVKWNGKEGYIKKNDLLMYGN